ncbi:hypothetical protein [Paenibacillus sp. Marseille-Q4541]|uniref:IS66 family insertion sequence element accessory protein TnpA n=1 Tax=Paenibacillus sp. Marseille-Q4541 TaxID=2831522 RepID=UPI001BA56CC7|nr:hypothetical protein [Paenibacillus sp. Marseille-Q4541]
MSKQQRNEYWQKQITAYRNSGLSMKAWCAANELKLVIQLCLRTLQLERQNEFDDGQVEQ